MPGPQPYIVGRRSEVERFAALVADRVPHWLLNIYGPGGIGKTVVGQKMTTYAQQQGWPLAFVDGIRPDLTPDRILYTVGEALSDDERLAGAFRDFDRAFEEYLIVQEVLRRGGGLQSMFDVVGTIKDPAGLTKILGSLGKTVTETLKQTITNRFALERYLRGVEKSLTQARRGLLPRSDGRLGKSGGLLPRRGPVPDTRVARSGCSLGRAQPASEVRTAAMARQAIPLVG